MKKFRNLLLAIVVLFMSINVNAMTENELVAKIKKAYVIDGVEVTPVNGKYKVDKLGISEISRSLKVAEAGSPETGPANTVFALR